MRREDTPEEAAFRAEARAWLEANAPAEGFARAGHAHTPEAEAAWFERCRAWQRTLFDGGWAAITLPENVGGRGGTPAQQLIFDEEQAAFDVTTGFLHSSLALIVPALLTYGSDEQKERFLRPTLRGDVTWCQLFSEPEAGSDLAALRCRAERDGDELVVNGQKLWTTSAQFCEWGFLLVRSDPEVPKHQGISFVLVDMKSPGIEVRPLPTITGGRHFNEVFFSDVRVPLENVVGGLGGGWAVARLVLAHESVSIGTSAARNDATLDLVRVAKARGSFEDPVVRQGLAASYIEERVLGWLGDRIRNAVLDGEHPDVDGSVVKVLWAESRARKGELAMQVLGPDAMLDGDDTEARGFWQNLLLDRYMGTIGGGTVEVHRNGIGERVLGLPREPRPDREVPFRELKTSR